MQAFFGDLRLETTNGGITVRDSGGSVDAESTNGGIQVSLSEVAADEKMSFKTTNGGIKLHLPTSVRASLLAKTANGSIKSDFPIAVHGRINTSRLEGDINGGGATIEIKTTNGAISISEIAL